MKKSIVRIVPAALALAFAGMGLTAFAQTTATEPSTTQKVENAGAKAWDATKNTSEKAWDATKHGTKKAWHAAKHGTKKAVHATEHAADATGNAIDKGATKAADATRNVGEKIGSKLPPDPNK